MTGSTTGAGGSGVVILSMPSASFSGTTTGSPTESTSGGNRGTSGAGGKGVVILSLPTASYSGTTTGSPTVTTKNAGADTVLQFNGDGSYTA
jgi:hypothetical protein